MLAPRSSAFRRLLALAIPLIVLGTGASETAHAGDWPQWRYDAQRSAASPDALPGSLRLQWTRVLPMLRPAWPDQPKMRLDVAYEPIVVGHLAIVGSSHDDSVTAYDTATGEERWRFVTNGPVRFAPAAWRDRLLVASDDGHLYALKAADGALLWSMRGGPRDRRILGNERMISTWPVRGGPVVADDTVYFAAGIWPFMGVFLYAVDASSGRVIWTNDGDGSRYMKQPHNTDSFAGVAPQGPLVVAGKRLLVPGGRSVPACYDRATGKFVYYQLADNGKRGGGSSVAATDRFVFNGGAIFELDTEKYLSTTGELLAFGDGHLVDVVSGTVRELNLGDATMKTAETLDKKGQKVKTTTLVLPEVGKVKTSGVTALMRAGSRVYLGSKEHLAALDLPLSSKGTSEPCWEADVVGTPVSLVAGDGKLLVSTEEGRLYCFGAEEPAVANSKTGRARTAKSAAPVHNDLAEPLPVDGEWANRATERVQRLLSSNDVPEVERVSADVATGGYALVYGVGSGGLILELARQSALRMVVVEPDVSKANAFRARLRRHGLGGDRVAVVVTSAEKAELPPYWASLVTAESSEPFVSGSASGSLTAGAFTSGALARLFETLRPFGGVAWLPMSKDDAAQVTKMLREAPLAGARVQAVADGLAITREGPLPDSANWTHEHADAANTRVSKDLRVKAPLGVLWFGGPPNDAILPRHGHGPQPQVVDGRLFIEGMDMVRCTDIYTGRLLWETKLPGVGALYNNTAHQPGANATGANYVATRDGIYVAHGRQCVVLSPETGREKQRFRLSGNTQAGEAPLWGYINVVDDLLIGGAEPLFDPALVPKISKTSTTKETDGDDKPGEKETKKEDDKPKVKIDNDNYSSSMRLVVMDRHTGAVRWTAAARSGFRHNAICVGGGRLYCIDRLSGAQLGRLKRRGETPKEPTRLVVFDLSTGKELWSTDDDVFGTWLSYSTERDLLVEAGRKASDTLSDEPKGMRAYAAADGTRVWQNMAYSGPAMLHHDTILMAGSACDLRTGALKMREHPLTGEPVEWAWSRNYGCNTPLASEHLLTFRSGAAGYFDLCHDGGTGNFGGFRSSCTNNLIVAGGLINAPDYTRTCTCSYQIQTSLALVHMPEAEQWTSFGAQAIKQRIRRVGLNLGAPGDRKDGEGTLWLEVPSVGGLSPSVKVELVPSAPTWFRRHSTQVTGDGPSWVAASGAIGLTSLKVKLGEARDDAKPYTVRLHFVEPEEVEPGARLFDVRVQKQPVLTGLDVVSEAKGRHRAIVKEVKGVLASETLEIELRPAAGSRIKASVLCGVEILAEGW